MKWIYYITFLLLAGCQSAIPDNVKTQVEKMMAGQKPCFEGEQQDLEWDGNITQTKDSTVYRFNIPCEVTRNKTLVLPMRYMAIVKNDSVFDILESSYLFGDWTSIFPKKFNPKEQDWWTDVEDYAMVDSIASGQRRLNDILGIRKDWEEIFTDNVIIYTPDGAFHCDLAVWNPQDALLRIPGSAIFEGTTKNEFIRGKEWELDLISNSWLVHAVEGVQMIDE